MQIIVEIRKNKHNYQKRKTNYQTKQCPFGILILSNIFNKHEFQNVLNNGWVKLHSFFFFKYFFKKFKI